MIQRSEVGLTLMNNQLTMNMLVESAYMTKLNRIQLLKTGKVSAA